MAADIMPFERVFMCWYVKNFSTWNFRGLQSLSSLTEWYNSPTTSMNRIEWISPTIFIWCWPAGNCICHPYKNRNEFWILELEPVIEKFFLCWRWHAFWRKTATNWLMCEWVHRNMGHRFCRVRRHWRRRRKQDYTMQGYTKRLAASSQIQLY